MKCRVVITTDVLNLEGKPRTFAFDVEAQNGEEALAELDLTAEWFRIPEHPHIAQVRCRQIVLVEVVEPAQGRVTLRTVRGLL